MKKLKLFGNPAGGFQCKFNRAAKLYDRKKELLKKMDSFMQTESVTERFRCALAVKLMMLTGVRIGNENSAVGYVSKRKDALGRTIKTFGLTTLNREHVRVRGSNLHIEFVGKREVKQNVRVTDKDLVKQVKRVLNSGTVTFIGVSDYEVRKFISKSVGRQFCAKDFRTLYANEVANEAHQKLLSTPEPKRKSDVNKEVKRICEMVAEKLGNTASVCKRSYIDQRFLEYHVEQRF